MEKINHYKKLIVTAINEGVDDYESEKKKPYEIKNEIIENEGKYKRVVAAVELLMELMPEVLSEKIKKVMDNKDYSELPFDMERYNFQEKIGKGFVSKVHLLESKASDQPSYVLKLDFNNHGNVEDLHKIAAEQHREYERIKRVYKNISGLIPDEQSLIITDKKDKSPTIATLQKFVGGNLRDIFKEIDKEELIQLLIKNKDFREEFLEFEKITSQMAEDKKEIIDLLGSKNLSIADINDSPHLRFIDPHNISSTISDDKERIDRLQKALDYLAEIKYKILKN